MFRWAIQSVMALGLVIALAVLDFGPRANAAYLSTTGKAGSVALGSASTGTDAPNAPQKTDEVYRSPAPSAYLNGGGGMSAPSTGSPTGPTSVVGLLPRTEPLADDLVSYLRAPAASLRLSAFIDSILDPPRHA